MLCDETFCPVYERGVGVLYFNANHISVTGAVRGKRFPFSVFPPARDELTGFKGQRPTRASRDFGIGCGTASC